MGRKVVIDMVQKVPSAPKPKDLDPEEHPKYALPQGLRPTLKVALGDLIKKAVDK